MATEGGELRHGCVHAVTVLVGLFEDALHVDVAVLPMELHLLVKLSTQAGLLELDLLLNVLIGLDLQLGVDLLGYARPLFIHA